MENSNVSKPEEVNTTKVETAPKVDSQPVQKKSSNRKIVTIIIAIILILIICCCCGPFFFLAMNGNSSYSDYNEFLSKLEETENQRKAIDNFGGKYSIGETAKHGNLSIHLSSKEDPYTGNTVGTLEGERLVAVDVQITNLGPSPAYISSSYFSIKDENNLDYNPVFLWEKEPHLISTNLDNGDLARGWVTFSVPTESTNLVLVFDNFLSNNKLEFALN